MNKSPEEYFQEQDFSVSQKDASFTDAEKAFMEKYIGLAPSSAMESIGIDTASSKSESRADLHEEMADEESLDSIMRKSQDLQMVAFYLGNQELSVPTLVVQEVIRNMPASRLPKAPPAVEGVISFRGKMTPLIRLRDVLEISSPRQTEDRFIIVCRRKGLQMGLIIERVHTIYRVRQEDIDWNIDSTLGPTVEHISALVKLNEMLVGIVNIDSIVDSILDW